MRKIGTGNRSRRDALSPAYVRSISPHREGTQLSNTIYSDGKTTDGRLTRQKQEKTKEELAQIRKQWMRTKFSDRENRLNPMSCEKRNR